MSLLQYSIWNILVFFSVMLSQPGSVSAVSGSLLLDDPPLKPTFEWAVLGDSWASGVAYNRTNVYEPTDRQLCYRTTEAWGVQMFEDKSWTTKDQTFHFAACGGSRMADLKQQFIDRGGDSQVVWAMLGGNDAGFGSVARACIYQPVDSNHLLGWGPPWDEDPDGKGECKKNIAQAIAFMDDLRVMRVKTRSAIDDIFAVARNGGYSKPTFDLYVSAYVLFFNATTDICDKWTFAHDRVSLGRPKLVKGLRQVINDLVDKYNGVQSDVIASYQQPLLSDMNYRLHHMLPSPVFDGHRFCEEGHTFEDQFYSSDVWLWNLQYYDEKKDDADVLWVVKTDTDGTMFMSAPDDLNLTALDVPPILASDASPDELNFTTPIVIPTLVPNIRSDDHSLADPDTPPTIASDLSSDDGGPVVPEQYGFGWTARPFHPKWNGHKALKNAFIRRMQDDGINGVKPLNAAPPPASTSAPPPPPLNKRECRGLSDNHYVDRDPMVDVIENQFCPEAASKGPISRRYYKDTMDDVVLTLIAAADFRPKAPDCVTYLLENLMDDCDGNDPKNPANFKGGGSVLIGDDVWQVQPQTLRQAPQDGKTGGCNSAYKFFWNEYEMWGKGWATEDWGDKLKGQVGDCALLPDTWAFQYGLGDGREWTARFRTGVFQRGCVGQAGKEAGAPSDFGCGGSG